MEKEKKLKVSFKSIIGITLVSLLLCGLFYPLLLTGMGQAFFPYQANGELVKLNGKVVGSNLIAQGFNSPIFFHTRNETSDPSASGVDPDILLSDAYSQIPSISNATGISAGALKSLVSSNEEGAPWIFGYAYVNDLRLNLALINDYPAVYSNFTIGNQ